MTRCIRKEVNLKSTVYNQTGQNYCEQVAAYNSMSQHLRRILLAKSVVDTKNKNYMCRKNKKSKPADDRKIYFPPESTDEIIDRLAYDTQHHPMDVLGMKPNLGCCNCNFEHGRSRNCGRPCCRLNYQIARRQRSTSRSQRSVSPTTISKRKKFILNTICGMETASKNPYAIGSSVGLPRQRKYRYETDLVFDPCTARTLNPSECKTTCRSLNEQETSDHRSVLSRSPRSYYDSDHDDKAVDRPASQQDDGKKYVNFIYDITREIKQNGLYTDKELQHVFKEHINKNKGILHMGRMLYEIYKLKISLNVLDDDESDMDDELEDLIHAQTLLNISEIRPPTPPKVLDESKVFRKTSQKSVEAQDRQSNNPTKKVVLIDCNDSSTSPVIAKDSMLEVIEIQPMRTSSSMSSHVATQDSVVETEERIDYQGKSNVHMIQLEQEASYSSQFEKSEESKNDDKQASSTSETIESSHASIKDRSIDSSAKSSNLVSTQDETIETEGLTESAPAD